MKTLKTFKKFQKQKAAKILEIEPRNFFFNSSQEIALSISC